MLNIRHGKCEITGSIEEITNDFKCLLKAIKYIDSSDLLENFISAIDEEMRNAENDPSN